MNSQAFDIPVLVNDPIRERYVQTVQGSIPLQREISVLDEKICALVQTINMSKLKRDFLRNYAADPVNFIKQWTASQSRDLEVFIDHI